MKTLFLRARPVRWYRVGTLVLVAMALTLLLGATASSSAVSASKDRAAFRKEFASYLTQMQQVAAMLQASPRGRAALARTGVNPATGFAQTRAAVLRMTPSQLAVLARAFAAVPRWQEQPRVLKAALRRSGFSPRRPGRTLGVGPGCNPGPGSAWKSLTRQSLTTSSLLQHRLPPRSPGASRRASR
jgi:hypothetical protein